MHEAAKTRSSERASLLVPGFKLWRHLLMFGALATSGVTVGYWLARDSSIVDLWIVPIYLLAANVTEYLIHRMIMHRPSVPRALYIGHTLEHHRAFRHDSMEIESWAEMELVMMPWYTIAIFFVAMAPIVWAVSWVLGRGPAGLLLLSGIFSFVFYEALHALYHLPTPVLERLRLMRSPAFVFLSRHHRHHHRLQAMPRVNFNISVPLSDVLFGTLETEADWLAAQADRKRAATPPQTSESVTSGSHDAEKDEGGEPPPVRAQK